MLKLPAVAFLLGLTAVAGAGQLNHTTGTSGLLLIDKLGGHVRFFDPVTFEERSHLALPRNPHDFALNADHTLAYVPIYGDGVYNRNPNPGHEVAIVDLKSGRVAGSIDISPYRAPHGIQIDANGLLYVACDLDRKLLILDPVARSVKAVIDTEGTAHWIGLLPNGSKIYATLKNDRPFVSVIDVQSQRLVGRIPVPGGTQGVAVSPDGKRVIVMAHTEPVAFVIDPATDAIVERIVLAEQKTGAYKAYFSPDGSVLLTMNQGGRTVNLLDASNLQGPQTVIAVGKDPMGSAFSADGKTALVANHGDGTVSVIDLATRTLLRTFKAGTGIETLTYF